MIHSLSIRGYRAFSHFEMSSLGCVNLIVGRNNSGKTSVLEALYLLAAGGDPGALWRIISRRGERVEVETNLRQPEAELDISHLFKGHELRPGASISLSTKNGYPERSIEYSIREVTPEDGPELFGSSRGEPPTSRIALEVRGKPDPMVRLIPLSQRGGMRGDILDVSRRPRRNNADRIAPAQYISTESLSVAHLVALWNDIVLTDSEERVLSALRSLEPDIERIAASVVSPDLYYSYNSTSRGGFKVKLKSMSQPIPIGSLGDGIWRMLAMAIALIRAKEGVLLIDEIDTGLHFSVMADMWKLISAAASDFNVQVFATTHSYDCVRSLATICRDDPEIHSRVTIQRVEALRKKAIPFTESEIRMTADRQIEVR